MLTLLALVLAAFPPSKVAAKPPTKVEAVARIDHAYPPPSDVRRADRSIDVDASVLTYSPDGRTVVTGGRDKVVRIWQARTGEDLTGELLHTLAPQPTRIAALGWRGESTLVVVSEDGTVTTWTPEGGRVGPGSSVKAPLRPMAVRPGKEPILAGLGGT
ncbi:MAG TPA: hypothetical protein VN914_05055, partial [Polyangia bacterium]|nr:hypothetical protein [Polyangia bacterium]